MKIGIFGGCFNPPHIKHTKIAFDLIYHNYLDKVIYVPTGDNYVKRDLINLKDRIHMLELIFKDNKNIEISDISKDNDYQYTYQVLDYFNRIYPNDEIYFICGTDNLKQFINWKKYNYILEKYKLIVLKRDSDDINDIICNFYIEYINKFVIINNKENGISSSIIREYIKDNKYNLCRDYVDELVLDYIKEKKLYMKM